MLTLVLQMRGNIPRALFAVYLFCLKRQDRIFYDCAQINSLQEGIDFMTLASRDLRRHDVILATLIGEIHIN